MPVRVSRAASTAVIAVVSLVADGDAKHLYAKYGFVESAPAAVNMEYIAPLPEWDRPV